MGTEPEDLPGPEVDLGFTVCNLNMQLELQIHDSSDPTDHRPSLGMTQLIKLNRESVCDSKNFQ